MECRKPALSTWDVFEVYHIRASRTTAPMMHHETIMVMEHPTTESMMHHHTTESPMMHHTTAGMEHHDMFMEHPTTMGMHHETTIDSDAAEAIAELASVFSSSTSTIFSTSMDTDTFTASFLPWLTRIGGTFLL